MKTAKFLLWLFAVVFIAANTAYGINDEVQELKATVEFLKQRLNGLESEIRTTTEDHVNYEDTIGTYVFFASDSSENPVPTIPPGTVPLLGGRIDPYHFVDGLRILKTRIPRSWIETNDDIGTVKLPDATDRVIQFEPGLSYSTLEDDAVVNFKGGMGNVYTHGGSVWGLFGRSYQGDNQIRNWIDGFQEYSYIDFDSSRVMATGSHTRERTINGYLCIVCGRMRPLSGYSTVYIVNEDGLYTGSNISLPVVEGASVPVGFNEDIMATLQPPNQQKTGTVPIWKDQSWQYVENHRGKTAYFTESMYLEEYKGGPKLKRSVGQTFTVKTLGPLPPYLTLQEPVKEYPLWDGQRWIVDLEAKSKDEELTKIRMLEEKKRFSQMVKEALSEI